MTLPLASTVPRRLLLAAPFFFSQISHQCSLLLCQAGQRWPQYFWYPGTVSPRSFPNALRGSSCARFVAFEWHHGRSNLSVYTIVVCSWHFSPDYGFSFPAYIYIAQWSLPFPLCLFLWCHITQHMWQKDCYYTYQESSIHTGKSHFLMQWFKAVSSRYLISSSISNFNLQNRNSAIHGVTAADSLNTSLQAFMLLAL